MLELQIDNKNIERAFKLKFNADKAQFIAFIEESLQKSEIAIETDEEFSFNKLNPLQNYYKLEKDNK